MTSSPRVLRRAVVAIAIAVACAMGVADTWSGPSGAAAEAALAPGAAERAANARGLLRSARALVSADPAALGYRLELAALRPGLRAQTDTRTRTITLFIAHDDVPHRVAHDLAHEIGHAVDHERLSATARRAFLRRRGIHATVAWWPRDGRSDYATGAGDFAEVYALCHASSPEFRGRLAPRPLEPCALLPIVSQPGGS